MDATGWSIVGAALGVGFLHTLLGPDHTLPFLMLARARGWTRRKTLLITAACGTAHVMASLLLASVGLLIGASVGGLGALEQSRGDWAAWALVIFGIAYALWGLRLGLRRRAGVRMHRHGSRFHLHAAANDRHVHEREADSAATFWTLFAIFVLGPCEPLIPLFFIPAGTGSWQVAGLAAAAFGLVTVGTMVGVVALGLAGLSRLPLGPLERWAESAAGGVIAASGLAVLVLGV